MRIVMMGTGPFAVPTFLALLDSKHDIVALVTRPVPAPRDRQKLPPNPMRDAAEARGVSVHAPESINSPEAQQLLRDLSADLFVVCDYGQILKSSTLGLARLGGINLHGSLLPKYRGAAPINWCIYHGDTETGVTVILMTPRLDGGPRLAWRAVAIGPTETTAELEPRLSQLGVEAVIEAIDKLEGWDGVSAIGEIQDQSAVTQAPRLKKTDGLVDWGRSAIAILDQVRAFQPWPASYTFLEVPGKEPLRVILNTVRPVTFQVDAERSVPQPGEVVVADGKRLVVATGDGCLEIERVQPAGKRLMGISEFLNGYRLRVGDRFQSA